MDAQEFVVSIFTASVSMYDSVLFQYAGTNAINSLAQAISSRSQYIF
jgi:acid phosphatase family membrane protein YuiD